LRVGLIAEEGIVAVCKVDSAGFDALSELRGFEASCDVGAVVQASEEGLVHCCFVVVDCFGED